ncbi:MAG: hypothetical protein COV48_15560 [Elusimicrobia bacterium CG11_big_fil_rev_8_21_14_0_20_64_6]|nr:MAG: hypothetical protein COV48_15560 [Elusimicrobia bacterium CG11_big_fil_rev_8_21_14_0_20_64_6]
MSDRAIARLLVATAVFATFAPALSAGFVGWDDVPFIVDNPAIRGLDLAHLRLMARSFIGGVWIPLTWFSFAIDHALWGIDPIGYQLTSLLIHGASALLFYEVCVLLLGEDGWAAVLAALFFAVHPLRVESVAWAAERKGVLSGLLWITALLAHLLSERAKRPALLRAAALCAYALSLAAKPNGLTFPLVLLAADWARRRRPDLKAYAPYFALTAAAFGATAWASRQTGSGAFHPPAAAWGMGQALYGLLFYPWKTTWPSGLAAYYPPRPWFGFWSWQLAACATTVAAACALLRRARAASGLAACYALALLPMLGLVGHGVPYSAADRFSYLPCLAIALPFGSLMSRSRTRLALASAWLIVLATLSWNQCSIWKNPVSLWSETARRAPSALADGNLGASLVKEGSIEKGIALLRASASGNPDQPIAHEALGAALSRAGREDAARAAWRAGLAAAPSPGIAALLGASLAKKPQGLLEGVELLSSAVVRAPERATWRADLGAALASAGKTAEAERQYESALDLKPGLGRAHNNLGLLLERAGQRDEARAHFRAALIDPGARAQANHNLGNLLLAANRSGAAERRYREALRLDPELAASRVNLGNILVRRGSFREAAVQYRAALKTSPGSAEARANLGAIAPFLKK